MRRNSDERLRDIERQWRASGTEDDRVAYLRELVRSGQASPTDHRILAALERRQRFVAAHREREARQAEIAALGEGWVGPADVEGLQAKLASVLERLRQNQRSQRVWVVVGDRRDRFDSGIHHRVAGTPWEREAGYIGRSTGREPIYLLVPNARSSGGGGLLMDSILEISDTRTGETLWRHPSYDPTLWVWEKSGRHRLEPWSEIAVERMAWLAQELGVLAGDLAMHTKLGVPTGRYDMRRGRPVPPSLRGVIVNAIEVHGEDWTRQAIEDTARAKLGNPVVHRR